MTRGEEASAPLAPRSRSSQRKSLDGPPAPRALLNSITQVRLQRCGPHPGRAKRKLSRMTSSATTLCGLATALKSRSFGGGHGKVAVKSSYRKKFPSF